MICGHHASRPLAHWAIALSHLLPHTSPHFPLLLPPPPHSSPPQPSHLLPPPPLPRSVSWCLPCGVSAMASVVPYFYCLYFAALLVHRERRDDLACRHKYGRCAREHHKGDRALQSMVGVRTRGVSKHHIGGGRCKVWQVCASAMLHIQREGRCEDMAGAPGGGGEDSEGRGRVE